MAEEEGSTDMDSQPAPTEHENSVEEMEHPPLPPPSSIAVGADLPVGGFFNRTRMIAKTLSLTTRQGQLPSDPQIPLQLPTPQPSFPGATAAVPPLELPNSCQRTTSTRHTRTTSIARPAAVRIEDYLESLLPSSGFAVGMKTPGFPPVSRATPQQSGNGSAPTTNTESCTDHEQVQNKDAVSNAETNKDESGTISAEPHLPAAAVPSLSQTTIATAAQSVQHSSNGAFEDEDDLGKLAKTHKLLTTYKFQQVTADGGVEITFDDLDEAADMGTADLDELCDALDAVVEDQSKSQVDDAELEALVARELQSLVSMQKTLGGRVAEPSEGSERGNSVDQLIAEFKLDETVRPTSDGQLAAQQDQTPFALPIETVSTQEHAATPVPVRPKLSTLPEEDYEETAEKTIPAVPTSREQVQTSATLLQQLQSVRTQLTATIQLGFKQGRFRRLNIAILVVGTRGDVQPFIGIGLKLKEYGHRVRIASHAVYREFVTGFGLEFYPIGGDPRVLSEFVVKHRGIMPGWNVKDALQQREQVREILYSTWGACTQPDPKYPNKVFMADAIVANPPCYGHTHCAEALNIPIHVVFTMPWTPTKSFPQPFARINTNMKGNNSKARKLMNWLSYFAMEDLAWLGMSTMQKDFRQRVLGLKSWNKYSTSHAIYYSQVPITYIWSPSLVPRPQDWPSHCEVVGFCSVELQKLTSYTPPEELETFLKAGAPPVYIGFGSLVVDRPAALTDAFLKALERTGLRAIIQRGWGGLGGEYGKQADSKEGKTAPLNVLFIDSAPHDWLFQHVSAVIHHGGAGTTAAGLLAGKPTFIVPFFGDQPFWGAACERAGVGPAPVAIDDLTTDRIVDALKELILPTRQRAAAELAKQMKAEDGIAAAVDHIHRTLYTAILGKSIPIWMRPVAAQDDDGEASQGAAPVSRIQEMETEEGEGFLRGILRIPGGIIKKVTTPRKMASPRLHEPSGRPGPKTPRTPRSCAADSKDNPGSVPVVEAGSCRGGFFGFLGC